MSAVVLVLSLSGYLGSTGASYTHGSMSGMGSSTTTTTTNAAYSLTSVAYVPPAHGPCANKLCGETCVVQQDMAGLCDIHGQCSFNYEAVKKSCPSACPAVCKMYCLFGNVLDSRGCPICRCNAAPPTTTTTTTPMCGPVCQIACEFGNVLDSSGCPICQCNQAPPPTVVTTTPTCGPVCAIHCDFGKVLNSAGCPTCKCNEAPPTTTGCPVLLPCMTNCEFGTVLDAAGCHTCECKTKFLVRGSLVLESSNMSRTVADVNLYVSFAWAIAHVAGTIAHSVQINSVSFPRRLSQHLASSDISRRFLGAPMRMQKQTVNFTIEDQSRVSLERMAVQLSRTSPAEMQAAIYQNLGALHQIHVLSITAAVVEEGTPIARLPAPGGSSSAKSRSNHLIIGLSAVALTISSIGCLLSVFAVFWIFCRHSARVTDESAVTGVVVPHNGASPEAGNVKSAVPNGCQVTASNSAKEKTISDESDSVDDASTQASTSPSRSGSTSSPFQ